MKMRFLLTVTDFVALTFSYFVASQWFHPDHRYLIITYVFFLIVKAFLFIRLGLYRSLLRFAGLPLAANIVKASTLASLICFFVLNFPQPQPLSVGFFATDFLMTTFLIGLIRFAPRYLLESWKQTGSRRILIYGVGELGEEVARKLLRNPGDYHLVGFLDDDVTKIGKRVHNLPIHGPMADLSQIIAKHDISELIIATSSLSGEEIRAITRHCRQHDIFCRIAPKFTDMLKQDVDIKNIDISDLLRREPKDLDEPQILRFIRGKTVLITGAGGSIGSELARQCIRYGASRMVLIDQSEFNLYSLEEELTSSKIPIRFCLTNILGNENLENIFRIEKPAIVFHAAAYKHVPIVEANPCEGIENNVLGTIRISELAEKYGVDKMVLISTDKAVRPTSVMGASKRIAELFIQNLNTRSRTEFVAVRFGNVLGSSGSVIPKFIEQINRGGPVTVTHPEVTRYFMLINEAVQLVLQAGSIGNGGEIFILNMGNPVRIAEMAEDLIFLSGREPHKDIKIEYTGLRPGEKLYEELLHDEAEKKTQYENITIGKATYVNWPWLSSHIDSLLKHATSQNQDEVLKVVKLLVPEYIRSPQDPSVALENLIMLRSAQSS